MDIAKTIHKDKSFHPINHCFIKSMFLLVIQFHLECIINRIHHRNRAYTSFCLWKRYSKWTYRMFFELSTVINHAMIDTDRPFFKINVFPSDTDCFSYSTTCSKQELKKWCPVVKCRTFINIAYKGSLLFHCQSVSHTMIFPRLLFNLCHYSITWINTNDVITHSKLKCRV